MTRPSFLRAIHDRQGRPAAEALSPLGPVSLARGRVHEICGAARRTLAVMAAGTGRGEDATGRGRDREPPVLWIRPGWATEAVNGAAVAEWADPGRLVFADTRREAETLWAMEEALRAGCVPLVVAELTAAPSLTAVRRLHLAAAAGAALAAASGERAPVGLLLTGQATAPGVETRWSFRPDHAPDALCWRLELLRARMRPPGAWRIARLAGGALLAEAAAPA